MNAYYSCDMSNDCFIGVLYIFQCWTAASLLKQKIDHKESLALAKQHLGFDCKKEQADYVYSMLQCLKRVFLYKMEKLKVTYCPEASELCTKDVSKDQLNARLSESETSNMAKVKIEVEDWSTGQECNDKLNLLKVAQKDISKSIRGIKKKCHKQMAKLLQKQQEEKEDINRRYEEEKVQLENKRKTEAAVIRLYSHGKMQTDRLKILDNDYAKQLEELKHERDTQLENLEAQHVAAMNKVREREDRWVKGVKTWLEVELSNNPLSNEVGHGVQCLQTVEQENARENQENIIHVSSQISEGQNPNKLVNITLVGVVETSGVHEIMPDDAVAHSFPLKTAALQLRPYTEGDELYTIASEETSIARLTEHREAGNSNDNQENVVSLNPCSSEQILDGATTSMPDGEVSSRVPEAASSSNGTEIMDIPPPEEHIATVGILPVPDGEVNLRVPQHVRSHDGAENATPLDPSSREHILDGAGSCIPGAEVLSRVSESSPSEIVDGGNIDRENDDACAMTTDNATGVQQQDSVGYNVNIDLCLDEQSPVNPHSMQTQTTEAHDSPVPSNQVYHSHFKSCSPLDHYRIFSIAFKGPFLGYIGIVIFF